MPEATLVEAVNLALARAMADDQRVILLGEDIGKDGGVFRATDGLLARFGPERVLDTPLAEVAIAGVSIGLAAQGFHPVAEIQFMGFAYATIDQLLNHAARLRNRTRGRLTCPMVMRTPCGAGIHAPEHHSESGEACFTNIPGLRVVIPSSPQRGYGLLLAAIRDPDPRLSSLNRPGSTARFGSGLPMTGMGCRSISASSCARTVTSRWSAGARSFAKC